jgi:hypothetical protein
MSLHAGRDSVVDLLLESTDRLEPGLTALDARLRLDDEVELDALLRDALGYPVVVLLVRGEIATELARIAAVVGALRRGRFLLQRLYGARGLDPTLRPRCVLLAPRFPDDAPALLDLLSGVEVTAFEYRVVSGGARPVLDLVSFHRPRATIAPAAPPVRAAAPPEPARAPAPRPAARAAAEPAAPDGARGLYLRARESIRALSSHVSENSVDGHVQYTVGERVLARLALDQGGFRIRIGEQGKELAVADDDGLNASLNAVFELYFNELGPDRTTA